MIRKSDFYKRYKISDARPLNISKHYVVVSSLADTLVDFLENEFMGLFDVNDEPIKDTNACVKVSEDFLAYFFKEFMGTIFGRDYLKIRFVLEDEIFKIIVRSDTHLPVTCDEMNCLTRIVHDTGLSIYIDNDIMILYSPVRRMTRRMLHSLSVNRFRQKLVEIFFTGGPPAWDEEEN